jgi:hypothetical protein
LTGRARTFQDNERRTKSQLPCFSSKIGCLANTSALRSSERGVEAFEAGLGPKLSGFVVIPKRRRSFRQLEPFRFPPRVDVNIRPEGAGFVERSDPHEPEIGSSSIVAPDRGLALGAAIDVVRTILSRHWYGYWIAAEQLDRLSLDDGVEYESAARQPLAVVAMAAVDKHWFVEELVADGSARAAAAELLCHGANDPSEANSSSVVRAHVLPHLVMPIGPVVTAFRAPVVQVMSDAAVPENL